MSDYVVYRVLVLAVIVTLFFRLLTVTTTHSAPREVSVELAGCEKFLRSSPNCVVSLQETTYHSLDKLLLFKTKEHKAAFWLGFAIHNYVECPAFTPAFQSRATPEDLFKEYFSKDINIGDGALLRERDAPYALAYFAGEGLFFELNDYFGKSVVCTMIYDAMGPQGKIASLLKVIP